MVNPDLKKQQETELHGRLQKLMFIRVLFLSLLLGASIFIQIRETKTYFGDIQTTHYLLIAFLYALTFVYVILLKSTQNLSKLAYFQLLMDTAFVTAIIYSTGGIESIFSFLYILAIINGSILLYRRGGMIIASASSILYGLLLDLQYYSIIHPSGGMLIYPNEYQRIYVFYTIMVNIVGFYVIAFLSSYPSEQARKSRVELKAKQDDFVKLEALNEWIIRSINSGLISIDGLGRILLFNPAAEVMFNKKANQAIGKDISDIIPLIAEHLEYMGGSLNQGPGSKPEFVDIPYNSKEGAELYIRFSISPLKIQSGDQKGQILVFQDITEMKKIEEEMKRVEGLAMVGELAAGIAHEIRNPMASISGSIQVLNEGLEKDEVNSRLMGIVLREINRLNHLVNDFLLYARPKPKNLIKFNLDQMITESYELFRNSGKWNQEVVLKTEFHDNVELKSDPEQIKQILWNIFLNAIDAMPDGGLLRISIKAEEDPNVSEYGQKMVKISIRDSGDGFSEDSLPHLFTPFFTTKKGGSGLGLAIVKRIVEGLGGRVSGRNHPDGGAEINIFLQKLE